MRFAACATVAGKPHCNGKTVRKLFGSEKLPRVVIIDQTQEVHIHRSSEPLHEQKWIQILTEHQPGEKPAPPDVEESCPT